MSEQNLKFAIAYDFDGTLSKNNMQEYDFLPKIGVSSKDFWKEANDITQNNFSDPTLTYMYLMLHKARAANIPIKKEDFINYGKNISYFPGVDTWFDRISEYGRSKDVDVEHYIISSGLKEILQGCSIYNKFNKVFASSFLYDVNGVACWPAVSINYTTKTQYLYRISKGALDERENDTVNQFIPKEKRHVPFSNMLFIGDGYTDIPSFRLITNLGGNSIAVYDEDDKSSKSRAEEIACNGRRTSFIFTANYSENSPIECTVKAMIDKVVAEYKLEKLRNLK